MLAVAQDAPPPLLGRQVEMALITSLLDHVGTSGSALVLRGGPGIGKSRLLAEATGLADGRGIAILSATGL